MIALGAKEFSKQSESKKWVDYLPNSQLIHRLSRHNGLSNILK